MVLRFCLTHALHNLSGDPGQPLSSSNSHFIWKSFLPLCIISFSPSWLFCFYSLTSFTLGAGLHLEHLWSVVNLGAYMVLTFPYVPVSSSFDPILPDDIFSPNKTILSESWRSFRKMLGASSCIGGQLTDTKHKPSQANNLLDNDDDCCKLPYQRLACMSSIRRQCCKGWHTKLLPNTNFF